MKKRNLIFALLLVTIMLFSCATQPAAPGETVDAPETEVEETVEVVKKTYTGSNAVLTVIDVQEMYIQWAVSPNLEQRLENIASAMELANEYTIPMVVTYELGDKKERAMSERLTKLEDEADALHIVKARFDATTHALFANWLFQNSDKDTFILVGAETDVCVMQTAFGLKKQGKKVILVTDAIYSSEIYDSVALKRMAMGGIEFITYAELEEMIKGNQPVVGTQASDLPVFENYPVIKKKKIATLFMNYDAQAIENAVGNYKDEKTARMHHGSYYLKVYANPLFFLNNSAFEGTPPENFGPATALGIAQTIDGNNAAESADFLQALEDSGVSQVALCGVDVDGSLAATARALKELGYDVFIIDDMITSHSEGIEDTLDELYREGMVPLTYKTHNYGSSKTADIYENEDQEVPYRVFEMYDYIFGDVISWIEALPPIK